MHMYRDCHKFCLINLKFKDFLCNNNLIVSICRFNNSGIFTTSCSCVSAIAKVTGTGRDGCSTGRTLLL